MNLKLKNLSVLRKILVASKRMLYVRIFGMDIHETANFSLSAKLDMTNPRGIHVGAYSYIAFDVAILTHDLTRGIRRHTRIGKNCFIGARSIILPGITIGDGSVVGAGSVVIRDVPEGSVVAGNPARIIRQGITVGKYGRFSDADDIQNRETKEFNLD